MELERSISFVLDFTEPKDDRNKCKSLEKHFAQYTHSSVSKEGIIQKQEEATKRKKAHQAAKLEKIRQRAEDCHVIDSKVKVLLAQEAKRQGLPGTQDIKPMSSKQVVSSIKALKKDFDQLKSDSLLQEYNTEVS